MLTILLTWLTIRWIEPIWPRSIRLSLTILTILLAMAIASNLVQVVLL